LKYGSLVFQKVTAYQVLPYQPKNFSAFEKIFLGKPFPVVLSRPNEWFFSKQLFGSNFPVCDGGSFKKPFPGLENKKGF
jgi:hypothetical protein